MPTVLGTSRGTFIFQFLYFIYRVFSCVGKDIQAHDSSLKPLGKSPPSSSSIPAVLSVLSFYFARHCALFFYSPLPNLSPNAARLICDQLVYLLPPSILLFLVEKGFNSSTDRRFFHMSRLSEDV